MAIITSTPTIDNNNRLVFPEPSAFIAANPEFKHNFDYNTLENKPSINGQTLSGNIDLNKLGIQPIGNYELSSNKIDIINNNINNEFYPTTQAVAKYVASSINEVTENQNIINRNLSVDISNNSNKINITNNNLLNHINNISNPHEVTKDQIGLGNVDNTTDINKPISIKTQEALDTKQNINDNNLNTINKTIVGSINETNDKVSQINIDKADLSFVNEELTKKQNNLIAGKNINLSNDEISVVDLTKNDVGLNNVDNTSDLDKPISHLTQNALNQLNEQKADKTYIDDELNEKQDKLQYYKEYSDLKLATLSADDITLTSINSINISAKNTNINSPVAVNDRIYSKSGLYTIEGSIQVGWPESTNPQMIVINGKKGINMFDPSIERPDDNSNLTGVDNSELTTSVSRVPSSPLVSSKLIELDNKKQNNLKYYLEDDETVNINPSNSLNATTKEFNVSSESVVLSTSQNNNSGKIVLAGDTQVNNNLNINKYQSTTTVPDYGEVAWPNKTQAKGWYLAWITNIVGADDNTKTRTHTARIYLSKSKRFTADQIWGNTKPSDTDIISGDDIKVFAVNDVLGVYNGQHYPCGFYVTAVGSNYLDVAVCPENYPSLNAYSPLTRPTKDLSDPFRYGVIITGSYDTKTKLAIHNNNKIDKGVVDLTVNSFNLGNSNTTGGYVTAAMGADNETYGAYATVLGKRNINNGYGAVSIGGYNNTKGEHCIGLGRSNTVYGTCNIAIGGLNNVNSGIRIATATSLNSQYNNYSTAIGFGNTIDINGDDIEHCGSSIVIGYGLLTHTKEQTIIGKFNAEDPNAAFIIGNGTWTTNRKNLLTVGKDGRFAVGNNTVDTTKTSFILGNDNSNLDAKGGNLSIIGFSNTATGTESHTIGSKNVNNQIKSILIGSNLTTSNRDQIVVGRNNAPLDKKVRFAVGGATDDAADKQKTVFTVDTDGTAKVNNIETGTLQCINGMTCEDSAHFAAPVSMYSLTTTGDVETNGNLRAAGSIEANALSSKNITKAMGWYVQGYKQYASTSTTPESAMTYDLYLGREQYEFEKIVSTGKPTGWVKDKSLDKIKANMTLTFYNNSHFINGVKVLSSNSDGSIHAKPIGRLYAGTMASLPPRKTYSMYPFRYGMFISGVADASDNVTYDYTHLGDGIVDLTNNSLVIGSNNIGVGYCASTIGMDNIQLGQYGQIVGKTNIGSGYCSLTVGQNNTNDASEKAFIAGAFNYVNKNYASTIGRQLSCNTNIVENMPQLIIGQYNNPDEVADTVFAIGGGSTYNSRKNIFLVDRFGNTTITGAISGKKAATIDGGLTVKGSTTTVKNVNATSLTTTGGDIVINHPGNVIVGLNNQTVKKSSIIAGTNINTLSAGGYNVVGGNSNIVKHEDTGVFGKGLETTNNFQAVVGAYNSGNVGGEYSFIVGCGSSDSARSNGLMVRRDGNVYIGKTAYDNSGTALTNTNVVNNLISTKLNTALATKQDKLKTYSETTNGDVNIDSNELNIHSKDTLSIDVDIPINDYVGDNVKRNISMSSKNGLVLSTFGYDGVASDINLSAIGQTETYPTINICAKASGGSDGPTIRLLADGATASNGANSNIILNSYSYGSYQTDSYTDYSCSNISLVTSSYNQGQTGYINIYTHPSYGNVNTIGTNIDIIAGSENNTTTEDNNITLSTFRGRINLHTNDLITVKSSQISSRVDNYDIRTSNGWKIYNTSGIGEGINIDSSGINLHTDAGGQIHVGSEGIDFSFSSDSDLYKYGGNGIDLNSVSNSACKLPTSKAVYNELIKKQNTLLTYTENFPTPNLHSTVNIGSNNTIDFCDKVNIITDSTESDTNIALRAKHSVPQFNSSISIQAGTQEIQLNSGSSRDVSAGIIIDGNIAGGSAIDNLSLSNNNSKLPVSKIVYDNLALKQPKILSTPIELLGTSYTTVETLLKAMADVINTKLSS